MLRLIKMRVWNRIWYGVILDCYYDTMIMGLQFIYVDGFLIWEMKVLGNPKIVLIIQLVRMDIGLFKAKIFVKKRGMSGQ